MRRCSVCGLPGHTKASHKKNPGKAKRMQRKMWGAGLRGINLKHRDFVHQMRQEDEYRLAEHRHTRKKEKRGH